ncbi:MAG: hypothetical protein BZ137_07000 [Methanosphaera sp. rholeuAM130]|nr:hypothetical protein [Methanosphaera sp.]RAP53306.1 MAG: hypothetical protein BZ137_07000 [Methanosphaera sp. rholeuAM130]
MTLTDELYEKVKDDLLGDFPTISSITKEENSIVIKADKDTLWKVFEVLYNGVENIEFNIDKEDADITINF